MSGSGGSDRGYGSALLEASALQIGSGVCSVPAVIAAKVASPVFGASVWILTGALVWTGAASVIELGTTVPENGGIKEYLRHCYGDAYGFRFACTWIWVVEPRAMASISLVFAE